MMPDAPVHASAIAVNGEGVLILGPSGSGKSTLTLQIAALGGTLISDDRVILRRSANTIMASAPDSIAGLIEARGIGLIRVPHHPAPIRMVVDLGQLETRRLPPIRHTLVKEISLPLVPGPLSAHLASVICLLLRGGSIDPQAGLPPETR